MKFAIAAVVVLAVAMGVQSSAVYQTLGVNGLGHGYNGVGLGYNGLGLGYGVNSIGYGIAPLSVNVHGQHLVQENSWTGAPAAINIAHGYAPIAHAAPLAGHSWTGAPAAINIAHGYAPIAHAVAPQVTVASHAAVAPHAVIAAPHAEHGATYVAKNLGSVHTAPLPGHIHSAASINVAPAPGTLTAGHGVYAPVAVAVAPHAAIAAPLVGHEATYVAKNRGSVHTAPLPGHVHSAASINVAPAPGTY